MIIEGKNLARPHGAPHFSPSITPWMQLSIFVTPTLAISVDVICYFLRGWVFVFCFVFCSCLAFHLIASCALHLHTCSSQASEHFARCPFCNPALPPPPVHPSCFRFVSGCQTFSEWTEACQVALVYHRETTGQVSFHLEVVWYSNG